MKLLLATEGSKFSEAAIEKCCEFIGATPDVELRIVAAAAPAAIPAEPFALSAEYIREVDAERRQQAEQIAGKAEEKIRKIRPELKSNLTTTVATGAPAEIIVDEAKKWGADLVVVGSHGYGFWQRALLGSVSNAVVHHAPCSVLVVRTAGPESNGRHG
jgi:nucleotide-binding universal stress UspA family protein